MIFSYILMIILFVKYYLHLINFNSAAVAAGGHLPEEGARHTGADMHMLIRTRTHTFTRLQPYEGKTKHCQYEL